MTNLSDTAVIRVHIPNPTIEKTANLTNDQEDYGMFVDDELEYRLKVRNPFQVAQSDFLVVDVLPPELEFEAGSLTVTRAQSMVSPGGMLTYTIDVTNNNQSAAVTDVVVRDQMASILPHIVEAPSAVTVTAQHCQ